MNESGEKFPIDTRLLGDVIIELNISCRNVAVYPKGHPLVESSLKRAYTYLVQILELRPEITFAVARDTLIIDNEYLDKKNPVFSEFALHLHSLNITHITFLIGLTIEELYTFHKFLSGRHTERPFDSFNDKVEKDKINHIKVGFIDYGAFSFKEGRTEKEDTEKNLWEHYIYGIMEGTLRAEEASDIIYEIPPDALASILNNMSSETMKGKSYEDVITSYLRQSYERKFTSKDIKKLFQFISSLRKELKEKFLIAAIDNLSSDLISTKKSLKDLSANEISEILDMIDKQKIAVPEAIEMLLNKLSKHDEKGSKEMTFGGDLIIDDYPLSLEAFKLYSNEQDKMEKAGKHLQEIQRLIEFKVPRFRDKSIEELKGEFVDERIDSAFYNILLEIASSEMESETDYKYLLDTMREQTAQFLETGQYHEVLKILNLLEENIRKNRFKETTNSMIDYFRSDLFISRVIDSFRTVGRIYRERAFALNIYYRGSLIQHLMDALAEEDSESVRKFLISLITQFCVAAVPEAINRLDDSRWFVKRNMLYILGECGGIETGSHIMDYCYHENPKIRVEALKCLLKTGNSRGVEIIKDFLTSGVKEMVDQAIALSGVFHLKETVPILCGILKKRPLGRIDFSDKILVIRALGEIGDPSAIDSLSEILSLKSVLFKATVENLKEEVYRSLSGYPYNNIKNFIEAGLKSKNENIRKESSRLIKIFEYDNMRKKDG